MNIAFKITGASLAVLLTALLFPAPLVWAQSGNEAVENCAKRAKQLLSAVEVDNSFRDSVNAIINDYHKCLREVQPITTPPPATPRSDQQRSTSGSEEEGETVEGMVEERAEILGGALMDSLLKEVRNLSNYKRSQLSELDRCLDGSAFTDEEREKIKEAAKAWSGLERQRLSTSVAAAGNIESLREIFRRYKVNEFANWSRILRGFCMIGTGIKQIERMEKLFPNLGTSKPDSFDKLNKPLREARVKLLAAKDLLLRAMETVDVVEVKRLIDQAYVQIREAYRSVRVSIGVGREGIRRSDCKVKNLGPSAVSQCLIRN